MKLQTRWTTTLAPVCLGALLLLLDAPAVRAETILVKGGSAVDLQAALDAAQDGDVIELKGKFRTADLPGDTGIVLGNRANITIRAKGKATIDGKKSGGDTGLLVTNVDGLVLEGISFRNHDNDGVFLDGVSSFTARKCRFIKCGDSGIEDRATDGYTVEDCRFIRCAWGLACGYDSSGSLDVSITGCRFVRCTFYSVDLWASGAMVADNRFQLGPDCVGVGVRDGFTGSTVMDNTFKGGWIAVWAEGSGHQLLSNTVNKARHNGLELWGDGGHTCSDNVVRKSSNAALYVTSTGNTISGNSLRKSKAADVESIVAQDANTWVDNDYKTSIFP